MAIDTPRGEPVLSASFRARQTTQKTAQRAKNNQLHLKLGPRSMKQLADLKHRLEAGSYTAVVQTALRLTDALLEEEERGGQLCIVHPDGTQTRIIPFV
jgi:hypothetical protein